MADRGGGAKQREFARRLLAIGDEGRDQRARRAFPGEQRDAVILAERPVVEPRRRGGDDLGDRSLVYVRILPEIDGREMKAENVDRALQRAQPPARQIAPPCAFSDRAIVSRSAANSSSRIRSRVRNRLAQRYHMIEIAGGLGEARIDAGDGPPIGFVAPGTANRRRGPRARPVPRSRARERLRGQFTAELVQFVEIPGERAGALLADRLVQDIRGHERIAIPVPADPGADAQERGDRLFAALSSIGVEPVLDRAGEARQFAEEGVS